MSARLRGSARFRLTGATSLTGPMTRPIALASLALMTALALLTACSSERSGDLPALGARVDETSVSGISSGAYMAGQFQLAHGRIVKGAAIIAGGPYGCAESLFADFMPGPGTMILNATKAINGCMLNAMQLWGVPNPRQLADRAGRLADNGRIDPIDSVRQDRVYLFSGREDRTVVPSIVAAAAEFYTHLGLSPGQIRHVSNIPAGHAFITEDVGGACEKSGKPYVVDCDYDQAGELLTHIYGKLAPRAAGASGVYHEFDQRPFTASLTEHGMADHGVVYIPKRCAEGPGCRIHVTFHGCAQSRTAVGETFVRETGFARWADTNGFIVLYPQAAQGTFNPQGCWDWWGYTGRDYLTRSAPQITAVRRMVDRLALPRTGT